MFNAQCYGFVKARKTPPSVIPAKAGIQYPQALLDPGFRRGDGLEDFFQTHQCSMNVGQRSCRDPRRPIHSNLVSHALAGALDLTPLPFYLCNLYAKDVMKAWTDNALKFYTIYKLRGSLPIAVKQSCVYPPRRSVNSQEPWSKKKLGNTIKPSGLPSLEWLL
jgi:hypothetical protein